MSPFDPYIENGGAILIVAHADLSGWVTQNSYSLPTQGFSVVRVSLSVYAVAWFILTCVV
ncbi:hypothetical protein PISMIDRAFT_684874 [Pisolithus microcarpus 441]|uniref:Uncharacterized protein n=1 Tax=Pisolithus microcarpus 441 TaxID=765257 RepID=A0A0C9XZ60_9AGAM|nr:hypothetical protein PISMIDRAFT_684874 [Pisolithus microcarpus 441]